MALKNTDTIPAMLSAGEHVASNAALDHILGRKLIPAANQAALTMKRGLL